MAASLPIATLGRVFRSVAWEICVDNTLTLDYLVSEVP